MAPDCISEVINVTYTLPLQTELVGKDVTTKTPATPFPHYQ